MKKYLLLSVFFLLGMHTSIEAGEVRSNSLRDDSFYNNKLAQFDHTHITIDSIINPQIVTYVKNHPLFDVNNKVPISGNVLVTDSGAEKTPNVIPENLPENQVTILGNTAFVKFADRTHQINISGDLNELSYPIVSKLVEEQVANSLNLSGITPAELKLSKSELKIFRSLLTENGYSTVQIIQRTSENFKFFNETMFALKEPDTIKKKLTTVNVVENVEK